jgi:sialidase-1
MKIFAYKAVLVTLIVVFSSFECNKKNTPTPGPVTAGSWAPAVPVLRGLAANPLLRVIVSVPAGNNVYSIRKLNCTVNPEMLTEIQQLDIYVNGAEPFSTQNRLVSVTPAAATFEIPVTLEVKEGIRFIWFSLVLKPGADINKKVEMHCTSLLSADNKILPVDQGSSNYMKRTGVAIRKAGEDAVNTYRIPGIITTDRGTLLAVYDIRYNNSADLPGNIDVGLSRSTDAGKTWEPMKIIMDMGAPQENNGIGDPAILFDPVTKKIIVAALWSKGNRSIAGSLPGISPDTTGQFVLVSSSDDGISWTAPASITPQVKNPAWHLFFQGPGSGIAMQDGKLVFAAQYWNETKVPYSTIVYSEDHGDNWKGKITGPKANTTESQVVETNPGTLMLNMRDNRGSFRSVATTTDMGTSWTEHPSSYNALPDPVCMGSLIKAKVNVKGQLKEVLFFSNPNTSSGRYNMTIKASLDQGVTWLPANQLLVDERTCYGYSSLTKVDDNTLGILYEGTKDLYFIKVPVCEIIK